MEQYLNQLTGAWGRYILPILEFIIGLGVIVFVHELGHFMVAKWVGIKVEQFAFGQTQQIGRVIGTLLGALEGQGFVFAPDGGQLELAQVMVQQDRRRRGRRSRFRRDRRRV